MPFTHIGIFRFIVFLAGYILFLIIGGSLFAAIEEPSEMKIVKRARQLEEHFVQEHNISAAGLEEYSCKIIEIMTGKKLSGIANHTDKQHWKIGPAFFFTSTLVTTIGYGHAAPKTRSGKIFCILYAMVGIPLTLVLISAIVERLLFPTVWLLRVLNEKLGQKMRQFNIRLIHLGILLLILSCFFYVIPAMIFDYLEPDWQYLDAIYFCFITLTTVGLGDLVPGENISLKYPMTYKICVTIYIYLGISFMMLTLAVFYDIPQLNLGDLYQPDDDTSNQKVRLTSVAAGVYPDAFSDRNTPSNSQKKKDSTNEGTIRTVNYTDGEIDDSAKSSPSKNIKITP